MLRRTASASDPESRAGAEGGEPAAERAHHPPDMLADDIIADAELAQGRVHVVDEDLGEQDRGRAPGLALRLEPEQDEGGQRGDHVEAAVERVGHPALPIPEGVAALGDDRRVERGERGARLPVGEQSLKKGQERSRKTSRGLRRLGDVRYWKG